MNFLITLFFVLALTVPSAFAARPVTCEPKQSGGTGTKALFVSNPKGDFVAYYCPGEPYPTMFVCLKAACSLVGNKRGFAGFLSSPSLSALNVAVTSMNRDPLRDPELIQVWLPHAAQIVALSK